MNTLGIIEQIDAEISRLQQARKLLGGTGTTDAKRGPGLYVGLVSQPVECDCKSDRNNQHSQIAKQCGVVRPPASDQGFSCRSGVFAHFKYLGIDRVSQRRDYAIYASAHFLDDQSLRRRVGYRFRWRAP
jgi:hypothetical protein